MLILVAEDDEDYAAIVAELLRRESFEVVIAGSVDGALRFAAKGNPDMAVLDVTLSDGSGLDVARALRRDRPEMPLIFLSSSDRVSDIVEGFEAGADDFIITPFHPAEFTARVRAVLRRAGAAQVQTARRPSKIVGRGLEFDDASHAAYLDGTNLNCTRLEFDILKELAAVPGEVLTHEFLNERVWSYPQLSDGTLLKGHISSLRRKLRDASGRDDTIRTVHGVGYSFSAA